MPRLRLADNLTLPVDAMTKTYACLGIRGSGKTNTAVDFVEELIKAQQCVAIIDPLDVWWGLRSSKDGNDDGLKVYIFGGKYADVPLEPTGGELVARFVVENRVPVILSLKHLRKNDQRRFVAEYGEALYHLNKEPLFQVVDECARYLPQQVTRFAGPRNENWAARCLDALTDLYSEGRAGGIGGMLIGQRGSRINKDVLEQMDVLVCMRTQGPRDRKAMEGWVDAHGTDEQKRIFMHEIASMPTGTGYFWDPVEDIFKKVGFRERETFDSSVTPKVGKKVITPTAYARVNVELLRERMAETVKRAEADDPKALRARIKELEMSIGKLAKGKVEVMQPVEPRIERIEVPVLSEETERKLGSAITTVMDAVSPMIDASKGLIAALGETAQAIHAFKGKPAPMAVRHATAAARAPEPRPAAQRRPVAQREAVPGGPSKAELAFLEVLGRHQRRGCSRDQLAVLAGYSAGSRHVDNTLGALRAAGYVDSGSPIRITPEGIDAMTAEAQLPTDMIAFWLRKLGKAESAFLAAILDAGEDGLTRNEVAEQTQYSPTSRHVDNTLGALRRMGLVDRGNPIRARDYLLAEKGA